VCADFLAGRTEESSPDEILLVIHRLLKLLSEDYQAGVATEDTDREQEAVGKC